ncbi:TonB-dependent receptor [Xanthomonas nasturtii]|uniref:TonB-dependent receptor n=1 Tax=Xanthomonas nasturtii TaxID=1843581 RepID=A0A3E1KG56_9XANT|nr:TonB-dependent receptor [Xanthomonas nasturtii]MCL1501096.1 TonB-dependent receptor [Xanthomonas nasturtii]MCL1504786.1 TonB-dependent receptor [Xanthomonas nasturtii]MCL1524403.1 TonB-dependent receptor [Xanthomonas nasturtii]MCL1526835.1 TonB-dependent receptor [Xanthomonas nasturtii]MCL1531932.1 TonB-dependent receptor [Xanthomonas nasturtii]
MQFRTTNRKTPVTLLALSIGLALSGHVAAQDTTQPPVEPAVDLDTVTVTGYRASVEKALDIKRGEAGVVDAIVAEDIGKFPDLNLAESLQRIPGVVITREAGEGRAISVRGLGPEFTRVRINGMEALTTVGAGDQSGGTNRGRGFDFNVFASDLFSQLIARKTASADVEEGSLGATVDLRTARPFDYNGFTFAASTQAAYNAMAEKANPRVAGLIANTWADNTFGALLSVAYTEREVLEEGSNTGRWANGPSNGGFSAASPFAAARSANVYHPRFPRYTQQIHDQQRLGVTGSLQWKPSDRTTLSLDMLYSKIDAKRDEHYIEAISFSRGGNARPVLVGKPATVVRNGEIRNNALVYGEFDNVDIRTENRHDEWNTEFKQISFDMEHRFNDAFSVNARVGTSRSAHENPIQTTIIMDKYDVDGYSYDYRGNNRAPVLNYGIDPTNPNGWELAEIRLRPQSVDNDFDTGQIDFNWNISPGFRLKGGVLAKNYTFSTVELRRANELAVPTFANGTRIVPAALTEQAGLKGINGSPASWVVPNLDAVADQFGIYSNSGTFAVAPRVNNSRSVEEKDRGVWLMGEFSTDLGAIPLSGNFGVRYVETEQESTGYALINNAPALTTVGRKYDNTLPSFNLVAELAPDLLLRLGAAKVMSRPGLGSLTPGVTVAVAGGARTVAGGNPDLDPIEATNVDLGLEWYFNEGALLGVGLFYKDIESFIQTAREVRPYSSSGLPASLLEGTGATVNDDFAFSIPLNTPGGELKGVEANYTQPFTFLPGKWANLGVQLNYTWVDSKIQYLASSGAPVMKNDLLGLSRSSWNATLFYEGESFAGRVSATNRDDYLTQAPGSEAGFNVDGVHGMTGTTMIDASLRYKISKQLELSLEGINLTNEASDEWVSSPRTGQLPLQYGETGRQFLLGARYKF